jgi:hypothetical protein
MIIIAAPRFVSAPLLNLVGVAAVGIEWIVGFFGGPVGGGAEMRTFLYIFAICLAAPILFVTVDRVESNRPLAILLMILILGIVAVAVLIKVMP